jgi:hypothetical protein
MLVPRILVPAVLAALLVATSRAETSSAAEGAEPSPLHSAQLHSAQVHMKGALTVCVQEAKKRLLASPIATLLPVRPTPRVALVDVGAKASCRVESDVGSLHPSWRTSAATLASCPARRR